MNMREQPQEPTSGGGGPVQYEYHFKYPDFDVPFEANHEAELTVTTDSGATIIALCWHECTAGTEELVTMLEHLPELIQKAVQEREIKRGVYRLDSEIEQVLSEAEPGGE